MSIDMTSWGNGPLLSTGRGPDMYHYETNVLFFLFLGDKRVSWTRVHPSPYLMYDITEIT
jgi:hypothetical protein